MINPLLVSAAAMDDSQSVLRLLADSMPQMVFSTRPDGFHDYYNRRWYEYTGKTPEQTAGDGWAHLLHPDDAARARTRWQHSLDTGESYEIEYRFQGGVDGAYRWFLGRAEPVRNAEGQITRWFGTCTDIDDQKRAELEMEQVSRRERTIAEALQGTVQPLLPAGVPGLNLASYYCAALGEANVGGDFSDVFALDKGCHALVVGDLSGKGLAAAAQVATVRNMLRYALYTAPTLSEGVTQLNNILVANNLLSGFATLVVVTFDLGMRTLTYVSCGQEPALLRRTVLGDVSELPPTGPILGMSETAQYEQHTIAVMPGDTFALYTDGLTEAGPDRRHLLGVEGLADFFQGQDGDAHALVSHIISSVKEYADGTFHDDVCLLVGVVLDK